jgi:hypothetical protein
MVRCRAVLAMASEFDGLGAEALLEALEAAKDADEVSHTHRQTQREGEAACVGHSPGVYAVVGSCGG